MLVLAAASEALSAIDAGMAKRGYADVRPAHGFAFARIAAGNATVLDIADHLGVSKQAASKLIDQLVERGYVTRIDDPTDGRRHPLVLTPRGHACTRAAEACADEVAAAWQVRLGARGIGALRSLLNELDLAGPVRPAW